jgi:hypothetical protein
MPCLPIQAREVVTDYGHEHPIGIKPYSQNRLAQLGFRSDQNMLKPKDTGWHWRSVHMWLTFGLWYTLVGVWRTSADVLARSPMSVCGISLALPITSISNFVMSNINLTYYLLSFKHVRS